MSEAVTSADIPLPWQQSLWQQLVTAEKQQRLPHALLLTGQCGFGQEPFALAFARHLLCHNEKTQQWFAQGSHPDFHWVAPAAGKAGISVDQIRAMSAKFQQTVSRYRVVIISPAEAMNTAASNALLKTLEEPPPNSLLLLLSHQPQRLLPTIISRCQRLTFGLTQPEQTLTWLTQRLPADANPRWLLSLADNAPLQALALATDENRALRRQIFKAFIQLLAGHANPMTIAEAWCKLPLDQVFTALSQWLLDILRLQQGICLNDTDQRYLGVLAKLQGKLANQAIFAIVDDIHRLQAELATYSGLNQQYQLQALLSNFSQQGV